MTVDPTAQDLERARTLRESLLAFIESNTKHRLVFRPYIAESGETVFPTAHIDRELARILAQARAEGRAEAFREPAPDGTSEPVGGGPRTRECIPPRR